MWNPESMTCQTTISPPAYHITKCLTEAKFMSSRLAKYCLKNWISVGFSVLATCACSLAIMGSINKGKWREWLCSFATHLVAETQSFYPLQITPSINNHFPGSCMTQRPTSFSPINISILLCASVLQTARIKANNLALWIQITTASGYMATMLPNPVTMQDTSLKLIIQIVRTWWLPVKEGKAKEKRKDYITTRATIRIHDHQIQTLLVDMEGE